MLEHTSVVAKTEFFDMEWDPLSDSFRKGIGFTDESSSGRCGVSVGLESNHDDDPSIDSEWLSARELSKISRAFDALAELKGLEN